MSYGIDLKDQFGKTSISAEYEMIFFDSKYTGALPTTFPAMRSIVTGITNQSTRPTVYHHLSNGGAAYCPVAVRYASGRWVVDVYGSKGAAYEIYVFVKKTPPAAGWGIRVFGPDGSLYFDGGSKVIALTGMVNIVRAGDYFWDSNNEIPGDKDYWFGGWIMGRGEASIPLKSRNTKLCVSAPPAFFGVGQTDIDFNSTLNIMLSCLRRVGNTIVTCNGGAGVPTFKYGNSMVGIWTDSNFDAIGNTYGGQVGTPAITDPIWSSYQVSFIDGSIYD